MYKCRLHGPGQDAFLSSRHYSRLAVFSGTLFASTIVHAEIPPAAHHTLLSAQTVIASNDIPPQTRDIKQPEIEIIESNGIYQINIIAVIDAPARYVRHVLTDFIHIYRLNPSIIESDVVSRHDDGSVSVRTRVLGCAAYFCEELERVERVRELPSGDLLAEIVPQQSQFKSGQTLWRITPHGEQCEVSYAASIEPDIYIPPLVGNFLVQKSITQEMLISFANLEKISRIVAEKEWQLSYQPEWTAFADDESCASYLANTHNQAY